MFESTIISGEPELLRVSAFQRYLHEPSHFSSPIDRGGVFRPSLSTSLLADLSRFESQGHLSEILEVLAACVRHAQQLLIHLQMGDRVVPLTVFPLERLVHCSVHLDALLEQRPTELKVLHVEPAVLRPPGDEHTDLIDPIHHYHSLRPVLWELALRGSRSTLLPEIAGPAAYRLSPGLDLGDLRATGALLAAIQRLTGTSVSFKEMTEWPGLDQERSARLLNALYLQAGLIISRTSPAANSWFGSLTKS
jgi:hypothetical protein